MVDDASMGRRTKFSHTCRTDGLGRLDHGRRDGVGFPLGRPVTPGAYNVRTELY